MPMTLPIVLFSAMCTNFRLVKAGSMAAGMNSVVNAIVGDWQTSGIATLKGGFPLRIIVGNLNDIWRGPECERCWRLPCLKSKPLRSGLTLRHSQQAPAMDSRECSTIFF